jgi:hypothetical protein
MCWKFPIVVFRLQAHTRSTLSICSRAIQTTGHILCADKMAKFPKRRWFSQAAAHWRPTGEGRRDETAPQQFVHRVHGRLEMNSVRIYNTPSYKIRSPEFRLPLRSSPIDDMENQLLELIPILEQLRTSQVSSLIPIVKQAYNWWQILPVPPRCVLSFRANAWWQIWGISYSSRSRHFCKISRFCQYSFYVIYRSSFTTMALLYLMKSRSSGAGDDSGHWPLGQSSSC